MKMSDSLTIRKYRPEDEEACYRICLETGDFGAAGVAIGGNFLFMQLYLNIIKSSNPKFPIALRGTGL